MSKERGLTYDSASDTLYISITTDLVAVTSEEIAKDVIVRRNLGSGAITSIALIDFKKEVLPLINI